MFSKCVHVLTSKHDQWSAWMLGTKICTVDFTPNICTQSTVTAESRFHLAKSFAQQQCPCAESIAHGLVMLYRGLGGAAAAWVPAINSPSHDRGLGTMFIREFLAPLKMALFGPLTMRGLEYQQDNRKGTSPEE